MVEKAKWLNWGAALLLATAVISISLIIAGVFDPRPLGKQQWRRPLSSRTISAGEREVSWLAAAPDCAYTVRMTAAYGGGEPDSGYGLAVGTDETYLVAAVSPLGYLALWRQMGMETVHLLPWQTWPHVGSGVEVNEIWLDVIDGRVTVWVNREKLWQGEMAAPAGQVGVVSESFGETAVINFQTLTLFAACPASAEAR